MIRRAVKPDLALAMAVFLLCFFGLVMIFSASMVTSEERYGTNYYYVTHQVISLAVGLVLMAAAYFIDYRSLRKFALILFLVALALLIAVFLPGIGREYGGAHRWLGIGGLIFQPSEFVKLAFIIYLASWLDKRGEKVGSFITGFVPFAILILILGFLMMGQPDLGTLMVIILTSVIMFFVAGARSCHLALGGIVASAVLLILIKAAPYRLQRLLVFLNPSAEVSTAGYHINQAMIAVGSGGLWGLGFGQSKQKYLYLPQAYSDSIFAIIAEELGYLRSMLIIGVYLFLGVRGFRIARNAPDNFSKFLATGIISWIMVQAFMNISAMLGLIPLTGVPLPFISFGGSALIVNLIAVGILLNISRYSQAQGGKR